MHTKLNNIRGFIFDYGGTLDTNARHWAKVLWDGYKLAQIPISWEEFRKAYIHGERTLAREPRILPQDNFHTLLLKKIQIEMEHLATNTAWQPSHNELMSLTEEVANTCYTFARDTTTASAQVLKQLNANYPMVLVSNFYGNLDSILRDFNLNSFFPNVIESAVVGVRKPNPEIFSLGLEALGLPAHQVAVVGDSFDKDILPAHTIGCQTVWFKGEGWDAREEDESIPTLIIRSLEELL